MLKKIWNGWKRICLGAAAYFGLGLFAILYVVVFAPLAIFMKLRGKRFLPQFKGDESTFYFTKDKIEPTLDYMKRQW